MTTAFDLAVLALATYYVAYVMAYLDGPLGLADRLRAAVWARWPEGEHWLGTGIGCPVCLSFWAAPVLLAAQSAPGGRLLVAWIAVAGGATVVHHVVEALGTSWDRG